jgi:hypothetical protein
VARSGADRGSNSPFAASRVAADLVNALPAVGMLLGAVLGAALGWLNPDASPVSFGGIGIAVGLVLGIFLRRVFRRE